MAKLREEIAVQKVRETEVELMGGRLTVSGQVNCGSAFTFILPYKASPRWDSSDDPDEISCVVDHGAAPER
ncbi:hypothetical protein K2173_003598 [Erythroxylum novogranatense]|uniref:Uncharacterized protein n=1 Tax=Erythroxylum novogranatense TaxID=1862640 RepID=A0AAV8TBT8_9ROSI|nr:hypothetical protein K2173_003598 [Erythroxylum novogranatense]